MAFGFATTMRRVSEARIVAAAARRLAAALTAAPTPACPWIVDGARVGRVDASRLKRLARFADVFRVTGGALEFADRLRTPAQRTTALDTVARTLAAEHALSTWRDERYAVAPAAGAPPLLTLERAAARYFGIRTSAAHLNGVAIARAGPRLWFARRSAAKPIDPLLLDNLVGGGVAVGERPADALVREAWEEAGIAAAFAATATPAGALHIERAGPDGFQRETIFVYDLDLPEDFVPANRDGEVIEHRLVSMADAWQLIGNTAGPDVVTVDASVVALDWLDRRGEVPAGSSAAALLARVRMPPVDPE